jgi:pilus assembly protein CpaF
MNSLAWARLKPLLADGSISDILVNSYSNIYIERCGKLEKTAISFKDDEHLRRVIERIVSTVGRRIDEAQPMVDARLPDGSRGERNYSPLAIDGPVLSIRRFGTDPLKMPQLIQNGALTKEVAIIFEMCVRARLNMIISGGTGQARRRCLMRCQRFIPGR